MPEFTLYWEDVAERLAYAEFDDLSWRLAEKLMGYKKAHSLYIYHDDKLAAFYSEEDSDKEAKAGYEFYSKQNNISRVIRIKKDVKSEIDNFLLAKNNLNVEFLNTKELHELLIQSISLQHKGLSTHFLTQPQFFKKFETEDGLEYVKKFEELSRTRLEYSRRGWSAMLGFNRKLFIEYGKRYGLTLPEAESMTRSELISEKFDKNILAKRSKKYVLTSKFHKHKLFLENEVEKYIKKYEQYKNIKLVRGVIGNRGVVKATAFVLKNEHLDFNNLPKGMNKGMVLIVQNAWPELSEYYKLASAIVTNEGGITSHGVVVSREFGVPCIVATRIATKVFQTGDIVEVNADKGIVKIL